MAIIPICRGTRSGGQALAECLARHLDYPILGREVVQHAAEELGVSARALEEEMCKRPGLWDHFSSMRHLYVVAVQAALAEQAAGGRLVYHGLAGGLLLRDAPGTLCLRLVAPMERRVRAVMADSEMDREMARDYIREVDESRKRWVKVMYGEDVTDPGLYDLVVNLDRITVEGGCRLVRAAASQPIFELTDETRAGLDDFLRACRVRLALARDPELASLKLDARSRGGVVVVSGEAPVRRSGATGRAIAEAAESVPGVGEVRLEVDWFDPYP